MTQADGFQTPVANMYRSASSSAVLQAPLTNMYQGQTSASAFQPPFHSHPQTPNRSVTATANASTISLAAYNPFPATSSNSGLYYSKSPLTVTHKGQVYNERTILAPIKALSGISGHRAGVKEFDGRRYEIYVEQAEKSDKVKKGGEKVKLVESPAVYGVAHLARIAGYDGGESKSLLSLSIWRRLLRRLSTFEYDS